MIPLRIEGATHIMTAPQGHDDVRDLHVYLLDGEIYVSRWEPTPDELALLNAGGSVELQIMGSQPPVALKVVRHADDSSA